MDYNQLMNAHVRVPYYIPRDTTYTKRVLVNKPMGPLEKLIDRSRRPL